MKRFEDLKFTEIRTKEENQKAYGKWATDTVETEKSRTSYYVFQFTKRLS